MDLVVVDVETTGLLPEQADLIEIGAVRLSGGQVTGEFFSPGPAARPGPGRHHRADRHHRRDGQPARRPPAPALRAFLAFARGAVLVAHNAPFDLAFLTRGCAAAGLAWPPAAVLDTAVLARLLLGPEQVPDCRLATLAGVLRHAAPTPCHRALADAQATAEVLAGLLRPGAGDGRDRAASACPPAPPWPPRQAGQADRGRGRRCTLTGAAGARAPGRLQEATVVTAIVLIKADVARIPETAETIAQMPAVTEVYSVTGEFDLVAMVRVRSHDELGDVIPGTLNKVSGVTHTETHIAFRTYSRHDLEAAFAIGYSEA